MEYSVVTEVRSIDRKLWAEFVREHPDGVVFQTPEFYDVYQKSRNCRPEAVFAIDRDGRIRSLLLANLRREHGGVAGVFSQRSLLAGGPLNAAGHRKAWDLLLEHYDRLTGRQAIYTEIRNLFDTEAFREWFASRGYEYRQHLTILIDLTKSEEQLWKEVHSKRRNVIRKGRKEGVVIAEFEDEKTHRDSYLILQDVYKRVRLPFPEYDYFENSHMILHPKGMLRYFGAYYEGKLIGAVYMLAYKKMMYAWYLGSYSEYFSKYPNCLLFWEVFLIAKSEGYEVFDLAGAGNPDEPYGVRDFKRKFGGEIVDFGRYQKVHKPVFMRIGVIGLKMYQKCLEWRQRKVIPTC